MSKQIMNEENWINNAIQSMDGISKASPSEDLYYKIEQSIFQKIPKKRIRFAIAAAFLLLCINVFSLFSLENNSTEQSYNLESSILINDYNLYEE